METNHLIARVKQLAETYFTEIQAIRHHLHAHPELSFEEHETSAFVRQTLEKIGIHDCQSIAGTGLTFLINGKKPGKTIALRADMDALPIQEANQVPYRSKNEGVMHACGHDVHTASLLGAVKILNQLRDSFDGQIKIIFQPGEEKVPGGASLMINEGILENPTPQRILGQHVMPFLPVGTVGFRPGKYMASADEIYLTVKGKGGHAAMPEMLVDPIVIASQIILALQQVVSRKASPKIPSVLSFGKIIGEGATNVIPSEVKIEGTFRTFDEKWREEALNHVTEIASGIARSMGGECIVDIHRGYPFLANHEAYTLSNIKAAADYMGKENVVDLDLWMAAEDFAFYSHHTDACFYRLGTRNETRGIVSGVHTPTFDIDEEALKTGMGLMAWLAIHELMA
ncbi:MAG: M20 family metallopeptidase [Cyclobacteriaceae bacterium]|nr:M20 family metallopeptidase [Cyclobacteriaceae bacterium]